MILVATLGAAAYVSNAQTRDGMTLAFGEPTVMLGTFDALGIIDQTYARVEDVYYRPVDLQDLLNGSRAGLNVYLKTRKAGFFAPSLTSTGTPTGDAALVRHEVVQLAARDTKLSRDDLSRAAIAGMLSGLDDPYTVYLSTRQM
ncbi:MAG: hypothetical protein ACREML_14410, partial [Vulcanimicrobiaceae bacterium]